MRWPNVSVPVHVALNKIDIASPGDIEAWTEWLRDPCRPPRPCIRSRLTRGDGDRRIGARSLRNDLPGRVPFLYPDDEIASDPVRFFVAELVRETIFERYEQEIPYSAFCQVQEFRESQDPVYIHVDVYVERKSQKGIVIGKGGAAIRSLGEESRRKIEHFLGSQRVPGPVGQAPQIVAPEPSPPGASWIPPPPGRRARQPVRDLLLPYHTGVWSRSFRSACQTPVQAQEGSAG